MGDLPVESKSGRSFLVFHCCNYRGTVGWGLCSYLKSGVRSASGFTLVELLVVIAIIGALVALLLPAVQAAREASRRVQCANQVKQMMLSMLNHEGVHKAFPSGGITPWPSLNDYQEGGRPYTVGKQGLGWAFQILPYIEASAAFNLGDQELLESTTIPVFHCPSKRPPTRWSGISSAGVSPYLMDYAAAVPFPMQWESGLPAAFYNSYWDIDEADPRACGNNTFWGKLGASGPRFEGEISQTASQMGSTWKGYFGVITRSNLCVNCGGGPRFETGFYTRVSTHNIEDGTSNTLVIGEKQLQPSLYEVGAWYDDRGWTGGWDPDGLRTTACQIGPDQDVPPSQEVLIGYRFGSAHPGQMNTGFADGSVRSISFDIDLRIFNNLGHRADGQVSDEF